MLDNYIKYELKLQKNNTKIDTHQPNVLTFYPNSHVVRGDVVRDMFIR